MRVNRTFSYASAGVDRYRREHARVSILSLLKGQFGNARVRRPIQLPFGAIYPQSEKRDLFLDLQIEGVGSKTLIAELCGKFETIGIDAVAMAVNDVIRSGSNPFLIADAVHMAGTDNVQLKSILKGIITGSKMAGSVVSAGETGHVADILHKPMKNDSCPFDLFVSALGMVVEQDVIRGRISNDDVVLAIESSGIHSNGLTLARKILLRRWGGLYSYDFHAEELENSIGDELLLPTRIYVKAVLAAMKIANVKAAIHITGDGFGKFRRITDFQHKRLGFTFDSLGDPPPIFKLIEDGARKMKLAISREEMFRTFNMGYGFALIVSPEEEDKGLDLLNRHFPSRKIGKVVGGESSIILRGLDSRSKNLVI